MAFILISIELFKILVFFMQTAAELAHYSIEARITSTLCGFVEEKSEVLGVWV